MNTKSFPQQKELENAIADLQVLKDITAMTLHESNRAGKSGFIITKFLKEETDQIASEMYSWGDKFHRNIF